jgi:5-methylcytosine-specific restriction protein A
MARLTTLKPRVQFLHERIQSHQVERIRGRTLQRRRERVLSERPLCVECERAGRVAAAMHLDHVVPLWQGGADDESNLQGLCVACHEAKTSREAGERARG